MIAPDEVEAELIYDVLVGRAGASPLGREAFVHLIQRDTHFPIEYRFVGSLGFGGKFRVDSDGRWYVDFYPEDTTPEREEARDRTNEALAVIQQGGTTHGTTQDAAEQGG
jgi:hypothetical protein